MRDALRAIPNGGYDVSYDTWLGVGMGLHWLSWGGRARAIWDEWSGQSDKFDANVQTYKWNSFDSAREGGVTIASVYKLARDHGWRPNGHDDDIPPNVGQIEAPKTSWPPPQPIPSSLSPVLPFKSEYLPAKLAPFIVDVADRMQCPLDFPAVSGITVAGSIIGRKIGIRPKCRDDWSEVANIWAMLVGHPGILKSPSMDAVLKRLRSLEAMAQKDNERARKKYESELEFYELQKKDAVKATKNRALKIALEDAAPPEKPEEPKAKRYFSSDTTYEKIGIILADNPNGILIYRDEMISLLRQLDREEYVQARGFYLTAWSGQSSYVFDRVARGTLYLEHVCLSMLGATTPSGAAEYIRTANKAMGGGDGLIQRFGLMVWLDPSSEWENVDRYPDRDAKEAAYDAFDRLDTLDPSVIGAQDDRFDPLPCLRFNDQARGLFDEWRAGLERKLRTEEMPDALKGHFSKYRGLVPKLALINHLVDGGTGPVSVAALRRAQGLIEYLESHARRAYASGPISEIAAATAIGAKIQAGDIRDGFRARDISQKHWAGLHDAETVAAGLRLLCDLDWIAAERPQPNPAGGRPTISYRINPAIQRMSK